MDKIIYLDILPETAYKRIQTRNRSGEETVSLKFLQDLSLQYEKWLTTITIPVFRFNANLDLSEISDQNMMCLNFIDENV